MSWERMGDLQKVRKRSTDCRPKRSQSGGAMLTDSAQLKPVLKPLW